MPMRVKTTQSFRTTMDNLVLKAVVAVYTAWLDGYKRAKEFGYKPMSEPTVTAGYLIQFGHLSEQMRYNRDSEAELYCRCHWLSKRLAQLLDKPDDDSEWHTRHFEALDNWDKNNQVNNSLQRLRKAGKLDVSWGGNINGKESRCYHPAGLFVDGHLNPDWNPND